MGDIGTIILFGSFFLVASGLIIIGIFVYRKYKKGCTVRIIGNYAGSTSTYNYHATTTQNQYHYNEHYEYDYNGQHYNVSALTSISAKDVDGGIEIFINPDNPSKHYRKADLWLPRGLMILGVVMILIMIFIYIKVNFLWYL